MSGSHGGRFRGQSLVEFALILPFLMVILLITIDFGRVYLGWVTLNNAARIAANYAASGQPPLTPAQQTQYRAIVASETNGINCALPNPIPDPTYPGSTGTTVGGRAVVSLNCSFQLITPFLGSLFPGGVVAVGASADYPIRAGELANVQPGGTLPPQIPPNQDFTLSPATGSWPLTVTFTLGPQNGGPAQTWDWTYGDGGTASQVLGNTYTYSIAATATYTVTLTETNGAGSKSYSHTVTVTYSPLPVANFYGTVEAGCTTLGAPNSEQCGGVVGSPATYPPIYFTWPMTVDFTDLSTNATGATYDWDFGDGTSHGTGATPTHQYTVPGSYTVKEKVTTSGGSNTATRTAYVNAGCLNPVFSNVSSDGAGALWTAAHFASANLSYYQPGHGAPYDTSVPSPSYTIARQNPQGGLFSTATGSPASCTSSARVAPATGNPAP
jgi:PKD repeat protein